MKWRNMKPADIPLVYKIACHLHPDFYEELSIFYERLALCPEGCFVLEELTIGGYAISHPFRRESPPLNTLIKEIPVATCWYIHDVALLPSFRGNRATSAIVSKMEELARSQGLQEMTLTSVSGSHTFWNRIGFSVDPSVSCSTYDESLFMAKTL